MTNIQSGFGDTSEEWADQIAPPHLVIQALRSQGYKNAAYALAELIDNSVDAGADHVEILATVGKVRNKAGQEVNEIKEIAVLDNGRGMTPVELQRSLNFGIGTNLSGRRAKNIGKFGMGLPSASISQGQRVEVYSWQDDAEPNFVYLDVGEVVQGKVTRIPEPIKTDLPPQFRSLAENIESSGTLVVWSNLDRLAWRTAEGLFRNTEFLAGRMYHQFISDNALTIRMSSIQEDGRAGSETSYLMTANDPLYLTATQPINADSSWPSVNNEEGTSIAFEALGEPEELEVRYINSMNEPINSTVTIKASHAKKVFRDALENREGGNPGSTEFGKHARRNIGLSIVREGRELVLDERWCTDGNDPRWRWVGLEVSFSAELDELFGVGNNKQSAAKLENLAGWNIDDEKASEGVSTVNELWTKWQQEANNDIDLYRVADMIHRKAAALIRIIRNQQTKPRPTRPTDDYSAENKATAATRKRQELHPDLITENDKEEERLDDEEREQLIRDSILETLEGQITNSEAQERAESIVRKKQKYVIMSSDIDTNAFFSVQMNAGVLEVVINTGHPAYPELVEAIDIESIHQGQSLEQRLERAQGGLKLLLSSWARLEDEKASSPRELDQIRDFRRDWGKLAGDFIREHGE